MLSEEGKVWQDDGKECKQWGVRIGIDGQSDSRAQRYSRSKSVEDRVNRVIAGAEGDDALCRLPIEFDQGWRDPQGSPS